VLVKERSFRREDLSFFMTQPTRHEIATRKILLELPGMDAVTRATSIFTGADGQPLPLEIYQPIGVTIPSPAALIVEGYPDPGFAKFLGCRFMEMAWSVSLARLIAASGLAAITYSNREPVADLDALLDHLAANGPALGVDSGRLALWATSGHGPLALSRLPRAACAVLSNPFACDLAPATEVAHAAATFRFVAPAASWPIDRPLFIVRSGRDEMPGLNASLDRFVTHALAQNAPLTLVNHPEAPHSFELFHDSEMTRLLLRQALAFLKSSLAP